MGMDDLVNLDPEVKRYDKQIKFTGVSFLIGFALLVCYVLDRFVLGYYLWGPISTLAFIAVMIYLTRRMV